MTTFRKQVFKSYEAAQVYFAQAGPDFEEGPLSQIGEDDFYDAVESELDRLEIELEKKEQHLLRSVSKSSPRGPGYTQHKLGSVIEDTTANQMKYARMTVGPEVKLNLH